MKRWLCSLLVVVGLLSVTPLYASTDSYGWHSDLGEIHTTKRGYFAFSKDDLKLFMRFLREDKEAAFRMIYDGRILLLEDGSKVYLENCSWGLCEVRPKGFTKTVWTAGECLE